MNPKKRKPLLSPQELCLRAKYSTQDIIRSGFSMPAHEHELIAKLQARTSNPGMAFSKSVILRTALHAFKALPLEEQLKLIVSLELTKVGRPPKS